MSALPAIKPHLLPVGGLRCTQELGVVAFLGRLGREAIRAVIALARIEGSKLVSVAEILNRLPDFNPNAETIIVYHHGFRSAWVTQLLDRSGFREVFNLEGSLDAYSIVDPSVSRH